MALATVLVALAVPLALVACGPPSHAAVDDEDPKLLQEVVKRQEARVATAQADVVRLEREVRMVQMRRRILERAGGHDLASSLEYDEQSLQHQLAAAVRSVTDEEDALAIYRRRLAA